MNAASIEYSVEDSPLGRVVIPARVPPGFALFYTTIDNDGRLSDARSAEIMEFVHNRFAIEASLATCVQVHGKESQRITGSTGWRECDSCDALWSDEPNVALGIKVADCLPVTMIEPVHSVIANVHSGWRGAVQKITDEVVAALRAATSFSAADALAWLGPAIRRCCFEVGEEVVDQFLATEPSAETFIDRSRARPHIDLAGLTRFRLLAAGFSADAIIDSGLCTRCDGSIFHSYRRHPDGRRNLAVVAR